MVIAIDTLAYARRLREAGFTEQQAEGQAHALAAAMTDSLATKQDLLELQVRVDARFAAVDARFDRFDTRLVELEKRVEIRLLEFENRVDARFATQEARFEARLTDLEHRLTVRMGSITVAAV